MVGLTTQNFVSAATGIGVMLALIRGLVRKLTDKVGNFWVDMVRHCHLYPVAICFSASPDPDQSRCYPISKTQS